MQQTQGAPQSRLSSLGKQGKVLRFLATNNKSSWHGVEQELESKQASKQDAGRCCRCSSLSATKRERDLYKRRRGWTVEDDRAGRHVTARLQVSGFSFLFSFFWPKKPFFSFFFSFFSLNKGKHNQAPYEDILGYDEFFEFFFF
jgi:hypothetical protein